MAGCQDKLRMVIFCDQDPDQLNSLLPRSILHQVEPNSFVPEEAEKTTDVRTKMRTSVVSFG